MKKPSLRRWLLPALGVLLWLLVGAGLGPFAAKTGQVQQNDAASYLPDQSEATRALAWNKRFQSGDLLPAMVVYSRSDGLTAQDKQEITADVTAIERDFGALTSGAPVGPMFSSDGRAAQVIVPFAGSDTSKLAPQLERLRHVINHGDGLEAHVTGPAGVFSDLINVLQAVDGVLVGITVLLIFIILALVYRSPLLPLVVLSAAGLSLGTANAFVYFLAKAHVVTVSGQSQGILNVLVLGAATDYSLLLVSRYREELRRVASRYDAMRRAWRAVLEPVVASAGTVVLGLLCMTVSQLASNRSLGPIAAVGIFCAVLTTLTFLPSALLLCGRVAFWPFAPVVGSRETVRAGSRRGLWPRITDMVSARPRLIWLGTVAVLGVLALGMLRLDASGTPQSEQFSSAADSKVGQQVIDAHFPPGLGNPALVFVPTGAVDTAVRAAQSVPGVAGVTPYVGTPPGGPAAAGAPAAGTAPSTVAGVSPTVVDGMSRIDVTLTAPPDSGEAMTTIDRLRAAEHAAAPGGVVGGYTAVQRDIQHTSQRDRNVIIPLVLLVVFGVLVLLLRALVAPLLLIGTVVLSFLATMGVSGLLFRDILHFPGADSTFPLYVFVFLVALGIDYNIFLMTRVREETQTVGTREGIRRGLTKTGGVITSAGVVLAATFGALSVLPLVILTEIAFAVAFGVLLDTVIVRSLLVPALALDIGERIWWPSRLWRRTSTRVSPTTGAPPGEATAQLPAPRTPAAHRRESRHRAKA